MLAHIADLEAVLAKQADAAPVDLNKLVTYGFDGTLGGEFGDCKGGPYVMLKDVRAALAKRAVSEEPYGWINAGTERQQTTHATLHIGTENPWFDSANAFPVYTTAPAAPVALSDDKIGSLWSRSYLDALKQAGTGMGNCDAAYIMQPLVFARAILAAATQHTDADKRSAVRYEEVRTWSARQFADAWELNLAGKGSFDDLVDAAASAKRGE